MDDQSWVDSKCFFSIVVNNMYVSFSVYYYGVFVYGSVIGDYVGLQLFKDKFELQNYFNFMMKLILFGLDVVVGWLNKV